MIGLFFNTLPLRVRILPDETAGAFLKRIHRCQTEIRGYEYSPLINIQKWSDMPPGTPLFSYLVDMHKSGEEEAAELDPDAVLKFSSIGSVGSNSLPLTLTVIIGRAMSLECEFDSLRFDEQDIGRMLQHLRTLLEAMVEKQGEALVSEISLLSEAEQRQLVEEWNQTAVEFAGRESFSELFERQAAKTPENTAVEHGARKVTYGQLEKRANQIGHYLRKRGVGPEVRVGLCVSRSVEMVGGMLGILKAGGAYVPLDASYPAERVRYMLEDAAVNIVVTEEGLRDWLTVGAEEHGRRFVCLDGAQGKEIEKESVAHVGVRVEEDNLGYIYYTSGSTGRPKGVAVGQRGIVNYMKWGIEAYEAAGGNGAAVHTSMGVDLTLTNFLPLFVGGKMVLVDDQGGVEGLVELLKSGPELSLLKITPTHLTLINPRLTAEEMRKSTRVLVVGADNLVAEPTLVWREQAREVKLLNEYGPTETVVGCSIYRIAEESEKSGPVPIGKPIANMRMYVLDREGQPAPVGIAGELYIGGVGVARGYWGRPDLTAERFVPDAVSAHAGERLYKTGDRARYLKDGDLEFLGRLDHQVKIRGYRIETGEIEAVLSGCEGVRKAMVVVREDEPGEKRLVGYVAGDAAEVDAKKLREYLKERLPEYMVPAAFMVMEELPVRASGKIDPKDLPRPEMEGSVENYVAPETEVEDKLCAIWEKVLGVTRVGIRDNFFELGGDSILCVQVITRAREEGIHLTPRQMFERPTVAELAEVVGAETGLQALVPPPMRRAPREGVLPLSYAQQRLWFIDRLEPGSAAYDMPFGVRLKGELEKQAALRALQEVARRHEILRTRFPEVDGVPVQKIAAGIDLALEELDLCEWDKQEREEELNRIAKSEALRPFDLGTGPLLRVRLLRLAPREHVLLVTTHHIVFDGWSGTVLVREFSLLYEAFVRGKPSPLPDLEIQYADFAAWERSWLQGPVLDEHLSYWRRQLADLPALDLPHDRPRPPIKGHQGAVVTFEPERETTMRLHELAQREDATLFMVMLAAFQMILGKHTGVQDVPVGAVIANRNRTETEGLLGLFVNTLVLRSRLDPDLSFRDLLRQVRRTTLDAYQNPDVPFEKIVEQVLPGRNMNQTPLFQAMLVFQNVPAARAGVSTLTAEMLPNRNLAVRSDMDLYISANREMLAGTLVYDVELFDPATVQGMLDELKFLLESIVREPDASLLELMFSQDNQLTELR